MNIHMAKTAVPALISVGLDDEIMHSRLSRQFVEPSAGSEATVGMLRIRRWQNIHSSEEIANVSTTIRLCTGHQHTSHLSGDHLRKKRMLK